MLNENILQSTDDSDNPIGHAKRRQESSSNAVRVPMEWLVHDLSNNVTRDWALENYNSDKGDKLDENIPFEDEEPELDQNLAEVV